MKVTIIGTHSVGKTTLLKALEPIINLPVITEVARRFPKELIDNPIMEMKRQTDIYHEQLFEEMILDDFISDRSTLDNAAYMARAMRKHHKDISLNQYLYVFDCIREAKKHAETYDHMFYVPIEFKVVDDGFRCTDENERKMIDRYISSWWIQTRGYDFEHYITGTISERINKIMKVLHEEN